MANFSCSRLYATTNSSFFRFYFSSKGLMKEIKKDIEKKKRAQQFKGAQFEGGLHFCIMYKKGRWHSDVWCAILFVACNVRHISLFPLLFSQQFDLYYSRKLEHIFI